MKTVPDSTPFVPNPAAALTTFRVACATALPSMPMVLLAPLESPPAPFTVRVSAEVTPVLPTETPPPLALLDSVPPIVMLLPPGPPKLTPSS